MVKVGTVLLRSEIIFRSVPPTKVMALRQRVIRIPHCKKEKIQVRILKNKFFWLSVEAQTRVSTHEIHIQKLKCEAHMKPAFEFQT